jgi:hypothetical protein
MKLKNKPWSTHEDDELRKAAAKGFTPILLRLRRSKAAVTRRAATLKVRLKKPPRLPRAEKHSPDRTGLFRPLLTP